MSVSDRRRARGRRERACRTAPPQEPRGSRAATPPDLCCGRQPAGIDPIRVAAASALRIGWAPDSYHHERNPHPHPDEELNSMTRQHSLLGCAAIAVMIVLGLPRLASVASAGTEPTTTTTNRQPTTTDRQPRQPNRRRRRPNRQPTTTQPTTTTTQPTTTTTQPTTTTTQPTTTTTQPPTPGPTTVSRSAHQRADCPTPRRRSACASSAPRTRAWSASPTTATRSALGWVPPGMTSAASRTTAPTRRPATSSPG